jgi:uncharacterized RDD family membrane protein YckC
VTQQLPDRIDAPFEGKGAPPDPLDRPEFYDGLLWRRSLAFCIDACLLFAAVAVLWVFNILTFFILTTLILFFWAAPLFILYDTLTVGSRAAATFGMRLLGIEMRTWEGQKAGYLHALISSCLFWFLVPLTGGLILLVAPFSNRRRHVHDMLSGTVVINARAAGAPRLSGQPGSR